ncbi:MAG: ROK family transcriptional regulator [Pyrinomonadaceae bacterium]|nr:ROK family transcriptional regulator [Pyrinomonadaceae bacterium]
MPKKMHLQDAKSEIARPKKMRDINKQIVLNYIRDRSPLSRADIARATDLQRSTVSAIVESLKSADLVEEIGEGTSTGGRKPTMLQIKRGKPVAIGVDLTPTQTSIAVADLSGTVVDEYSFPTSSDAEIMTEKIVGGISKFNDEYRNEDLEVGISLPGITDNAFGTARFIPYFNWREWEIGKKIYEETGLDVTIDNDANAIALAELWFGREKIEKVRNFITVLVADGIGTGIIFDGQVYRGENGAAGEFGHMIVGEKGPVRCSCGGYRCWEAFASETSLKSRFAALNNGAGIDPKSVSMDHLIKLADSGDENAVKSLLNTSEYLGIGISNLIVGFSPQAIIVSGNITRVWDLIEDSLYGVVEKSIRRKLPRTVIRASSLEGSPTLMGAIGLVLANKFSSAH